MRSYRLAGPFVLGVWLLSTGCRTGSVQLTNVTERGGHRQWVWPYFLYEQPTVVAFWNTNCMQCRRDLPALETLSLRSSSVQLVTVVTGRDQLEIDQWIRENRIKYPVLLDLEEKLSGKLGIEEYPSFVYFDLRGKELDRVSDVRLVKKWFDSDRWIEKGEAIQPASSRDVE